MSPFPVVFALGTPRFMLVAQIVAIKLLTLNLLLMRLFALMPLCESYMSIQTMAILDLGNILITLGFDAKTTSLKM